MYAIGMYAGVSREELLIKYLINNILLKKKIEYFIIFQVIYL